MASSRLQWALIFDWNSYFTKNYLKIIFSILVGIFSHLLWDAFTHQTGYFVVRNGWLKFSIAFGALNFPVYKILQHLSSFAGGIMIFYYFWNAPKVPIDEKINVRFWFAVFTISISIVLSKMMYEAFEIQIGNLIATIIPSIFLGLTISSAWFKRYP